MPFDLSDTLVVGIAAVTGSMLYVQGCVLTPAGALVGSSLTAQLTLQ